MGEPHDQAHSACLDCEDREAELARLREQRNELIDELLCAGRQRNDLLAALKHVRPYVDRYGNLEEMQMVDAAVDEVEEEK